MWTILYTFFIDYEEKRVVNMQLDTRFWPNLVLNFVAKYFRKKISAFSPPSFDELKKIINRSKTNSSDLAI